MPAQASTPVTGPISTAPAERSSAAATDSVAGSLKSRAVRGTLWTAGGYGLGQILRLGGNVVLARLLFPEAFGLMTFVNAVIQGLQMFSDVGIGPSIIQSKRGEDASFLNTAWTIQVVRGMVLWVAATALAIPAAAFYDQPELSRLLPVAGLFALLAGFNSTSLYVANRSLAVGRLTTIDLIAQVAGLAVMIGWALVSPSVWALVVGGVVAAGSKMAMSHVALPGVACRFRWDRESSRSLIRFGRWIFLSTLTTFLATQSDKFIFNKLVPLGVFGVYGIALTFATLPTQVILRIGSVVVFPSYSEVVRRGGALGPVFRRARTLLLLVGAGLVSTLLVCGPVFIEALYPEEYHAAGQMIQILAIMGWFQILECTNGSALLALGKPYWVAAGNVAKLAGIVVFLPAGFLLNGFTGAIWGLVAAECGKYLMMAGATARNGLSAWGSDIVLTLITGAVAAGGLALALFAGRWVEPAGLQLLLVAAVLASAWGGYFLLSGRAREVFA